MLEGLKEENEDNREAVEGVYRRVVQGRMLKWVEMVHSANC